MQKDIVHTRVVSTLLIILCIIVSAGLSGYFLNLYNTEGAAVNEHPIAVAGDSVVFGYRGAPITFNGNESYDTDGEIISYKWDFGDTFTGIGIRPTHTYELAGNYTVTLTVMDNDGATNRTYITARISSDDSGTGLYTRVTVNDIIQNGTSVQGELVMVHEVVVSDAGSYNSGYGSNPTGWVKFYVKDSSTAVALDIYCEGGATRPLALSNGDVVTVTGIVELYDSVWEIKVRADSTDKVVLVSEGGGGGGTGDYTPRTIAYIFSNWESMLDDEVVVYNATIVWQYEDGSWLFSMTDSSGSDELSVVMDTGSNVVSGLGIGSVINVYGIIMEYQDEPEIKVRAGTDDKIELGTGGGGGGTGNYTQATVSQLLTSSGTYNNTLVCVLGARVVDYYAPSYKKVTVTDNSTAGTVVAFGYEGADIAAISIGDYVDVYGHLEWYQPTTGEGYLEIMIREDMEDRIVISAGGGGSGNVTGNYTQATVNQLLTYSDTYNNTRICVLGALVVDYYAPSYRKVTVKDNSSSSNLIAFGYEGADIAAVSAGDYVDVYGKLVWYASGGYFEVMIEEDTDDRIVLSAGGGGGSNITGNYTIATVNQLLTSTPTYNNTDVCVLGARVTDYYDGTTWTKVTVTDNSTSGTIVAFGFDGANIAVVSVGDYVDIFGHLEWYQPSAGDGYLEIAIEEDTDDRIVLAAAGGGGNVTGDYTAYTINTLLTDSAAHEDELVAVLNAEVVDFYAPSYTKLTVTDSSTAAELIVFCSSGADVDSVAIGDIVNIYGTFVYYTSGSYWEITVEADTDDRVDYVSGGGGGGGGDYTVYTVAQLIAGGAGMEDDLVMVIGATISGISGTTYKTFDITDSSTAQTYPVYCESGSDIPTLANGNIVNISGIVALYYGDPEIKVRADTDDSVTISSGGGGGGTGDYTVYTVAQLIAGGTGLEDQLVKVVGATISGIGGTTYKMFDITDSSTSGTYPVYCEAGSDIPILANGDVVNITGIVALYYGDPELKVRADTDDAVTVSSGGGGGGGGDETYTLATVNQLLTDSAAYEDENIYVLSALVTDSGSYWKGYGDDPTSWVSFTVKDNSTSSTIVVYCEGDADRPLELDNGTWIDISGTLFWYDGYTSDYWEIKVRADSQDNVSLASGGGGETPTEEGYAEVTVQELLANSAEYMGRNVSIMDAVVSDAFTYNMGPVYPFDWAVFYITDSSTSDSIKVYCEPFSTRPSKLSNWNEVDVMGVLGEQYGTLEIAVRNNDDDLVRQMSNGYTVLSVQQLLENDYEGTEACVLGAAVTDAYSYNSGYGDLPGDPVMFYISDSTTSQSVLVSCQPYADRPFELADDDYVNVYGIMDVHYGTPELLVRALGNDTVTVSGASGKIVYYVTDHGADVGEFTNFAGAANSAGFAYIEGPLAAANLSQVKLLVISNPDSLFDAGQLAAINAYVTGGGTLLLLSESDVGNEGKPENLNPILVNLGVQGRFNDDQFRDMLNCYNMWSYDGYDEAIPYFNYYDTSNNSAYNAGCFSPDSTNMTAGVHWIRGSSVATVYNAANDVTVIQGSVWGYGQDNDGEAPVQGYTLGSYPPILAANGSVGAGKVIYGGLAHTFSDANSAGWADSNISALVRGMLEWATDETSGSAQQQPAVQGIEQPDTQMAFLAPILPTSFITGTRTMASAIPSGRNDY